MDSVNTKGNELYVLRIEHLTNDFNTWKKAFDSDPALRKKNGVVNYRISQLTNNPNYVMIDLGFESLIMLEQFHGLLQKLWGTVNVKLIEGVKSFTAKIIEYKEVV